MVVGVTGHQKRQGIDWTWVKQSLLSSLQNYNATEAVTSLAEGTDQIFAEAAMALAIPVSAVIPLDGYERFFSTSGLVTYQSLLSSSTPVYLRSGQEPEQAFFDAGRYVVDHSDVLFAVWDGHHAEGLGGTGDVVLYALSSGKAILHLDPCRETINVMERQNG